MLLILKIAFYTRLILRDEHFLMKNHPRIICTFELLCLTLRYKIKRRESRRQADKKIVGMPYIERYYHIKVDWETLQIIMKYRDKLSWPMAGPDSLGSAFMPGGLQRTTSTQILSFRSFIASFDVAL